jgi:hypothetical protein
MLQVYLWRDLYNIIFKFKRKLYIELGSPSPTENAGCTRETVDNHSAETYAGVMCWCRLFSYHIKCSESIFFWPTVVQWTFTEGHCQLWVGRRGVLGL